MLKHLFVAALALSSAASAAPPMHRAEPLPVPHGRKFDEGRRDARRVIELLQNFDAASAQRDHRALAANEFQFNRYLQDELRETRTQRSGQAARLMSISGDLARLNGRTDRRALRAKRSLYADLVELAQRTTRPGRF